MTFVEPLIIHVISMKFWALCTCGCGEMLPKFLTKSAVDAAAVQNFRLAYTAVATSVNSVRTEEPNRRTENRIGRFQFLPQPISVPVF